MNALSLRLNLRQIVWVIAFLAVLAFLFWPTFLWMVERFQAHDSYYSHGWLVPPASAWLVWQRRESLQQLNKGADYWGLCLMVPCVALHLMAAWLQINFVSGFSLLGVVAGLVWILWGKEVLWHLRMPLAFLIFMIPLPGDWLINISFNMKLFAAAMATQLLNLMRIPALQEGSTIHVPGLSVIVDDTCSGLRSLISLVALAALWSALLPAKTLRRQKALIMVAAVPIALVANMVRILILVLLGAMYGSEAADSFIHYGSGIVVFGVALLILAWLSHGVQRWFNIDTPQQ